MTTKQQQTDEPIRQAAIERRRLEKEIEFHVEDEEGRTMTTKTAAAKQQTDDPITGWTLYLQFRRLEREVARRRNHNAADPELVDVKSDLRRDFAAALAAVQAEADRVLLPEEQDAEAAAAASARERDAVAEARAEADRPTEQGPLSSVTGRRLTATPKAVSAFTGHRH